MLRKNLCKKAAGFLAIVMAVGMLSGCSGKSGSSAASGNTETKTEKSDTQQSDVQ